jgi:hypothetical protein
VNEYIDVVEQHPPKQGLKHRNANATKPGKPCCTATSNKGVSCRLAALLSTNAYAQPVGKRKKSADLNLSNRLWRLF